VRAADLLAQALSGQRRRAARTGGAAGATPPSIDQGGTGRPGIMGLDVVNTNEGAGTLDGRSVSRSAELRDLVDGVLRHAARGSRVNVAADGDARDLLCRTCDSARAHGVRAEQLLLLFKEAWRELPEARSMPRQDAGEVLARVITVCIHEYYAQGDGH